MQERGGQRVVFLLCFLFLAGNISCPPALLPEATRLRITQRSPLSKSVEHQNVAFLETNSLVRPPFSSSVCIVFSFQPRKLHQTEVLLPLFQLGTLATCLVSRSYSSFWYPSWRLPDLRIQTARVRTKTSAPFQHLLVSLRPPHHCCPLLTFLSSLTPQSPSPPLPSINDLPTHSSRL